MKIEKTLNNQIFFQKLPNKPKNNTQTKKDNNKKLSLSLDALASKNALIKPQLLTLDEIRKRKKELTAIKDNYGYYLFDNSAIEKIAQFTPEEYQRALELAQVKDENGDTFFNQFSIEKIAQFNPEEYQRALELVQIKKADGSNLFDGYLIEKIAQFNPEEYQRALELVQIKDTDEKLFFSCSMIEDIAKLDFDEYQAVLKLAQTKGVDGKNLFDCTTIESLLPFEKNTPKRIAELLDIKDSNGNCKLQSKVFENLLKWKSDAEFDTIIKTIKNIDSNYPIMGVEYNTLQNNAGESVKIVAATNDPDTNERILFVYTLNPDNSITKERIEFYCDNIAKSRCLNAASSFMDNFEDIQIDKESVQVLNSQTELIYDEKTKEPIAILATKKSDILKGVYEKTLYTLADYDPDYDVLKAIEDGTIKGGKKLSEVVQNPDGSISYHENIVSNGSVIKRDYTEKSNGVDYTYSFKITDENGVKILDNSISFVRNSSNQTTTILNGKIYIAYFDDKTKTIKITGPDGVEAIDFNEISPDNSSAWLIAKNLPVNLLQTLKYTYWDTIDNSDNAFAVFSLYSKMISKNKISYDIGVKDKNINIIQTYNDKDNTITFDEGDSQKRQLKIKYNPEDSMLVVGSRIIQLNGITKEQIKHMPLYYAMSFLEENIEPEKISEYFLRNVDDNIAYLSTNDDLAVIAHELGHVRDGLLGVLSCDRELINIYNKEISEFNSRYTDFAGKNYIDYFSQIGGGDVSTGLGELIAETNAILTTYGNKNKGTTERAQFLAQNFPKTIAYIANKFNLNAVN